jgi:hypothetical protein
VEDHQNRNDDYNCSRRCRSHRREGMGPSGCLMVPSAQTKNFEQEKSGMMAYDTRAVSWKLMRLAELAKFEGPITCGLTISRIYFLTSC